MARAGLTRASSGLLARDLSTRAQATTDGAKQPENAAAREARKGGARAQTPAQQKEAFSLGCARATFNLTAADNCISIQKKT